MIEKIKTAFAFVVTLYIIGLLFVIVKVANGYQGGDMLSEHYRSMLQTVIGLF